MSCRTATQIMSRSLYTIYLIKAQLALRMPWGGKGLDSHSKVLHISHIRQVSEQLCIIGKELENNKLSQMNTYTSHTQADARFDSAEENQNLKSKCKIQIIANDASQFSEVLKSEYKIQKKNHKRKQFNGCLHGKP